METMLRFEKVFISKEGEKSKMIFIKLMAAILIFNGKVIHSLVNFITLSNYITNHQILHENTP